MKARVPVQFEQFRLEGGLDLVSPTSGLKPGIARNALNWAVLTTGSYERIPGYQRVDGTSPTPNDATYSSLLVDDASAIAVGDTIDNGGGETGKVIRIDGLRVYYTLQVGTFAVNDVLTAGPTVTAVGGAAVSPGLAAELKLAASNVYRALVEIVPGSGAVRGVAYYGDTLYAWRDNAGATLLEMHKATSSGWTKIVFGYEVSFTTGSVAPTEGAAITKGAVSATLRRIVLESGTWGAGTAAGRFITDAPTGGAFTAGALTAGGTATLNAGLSGGLVQALITFSPGGRVQTDQEPFGNGQAKKLYGCDGVNRGFEFNGTTMVPIKTGMATDAPDNVRVHQNHLFFSFGPSLQNSAIGDPYQWTPLLGAGETVVNGDITNLLSLPGNQTSAALAVYTADRTYALYGTSFGSGGDSVLSTLAPTMGAEPYTAQTLDQPYALAQRGVTSLAASQNYGNFDADTLTFNIRPYIQARRGTALASGVNREKSQYRVFYTSGEALYLTIHNGKYLGALPQAFPNPVTCWCDGSTAAGAETSYFGSSDGYVRQMDVGPSFDGAVIPFTLHLNYDSMKNTRASKRFRKAAIELTASSRVQFSVGYSIGYGDSEARQQPPYAIAVSSFSGTPQWDSFVWDNFTWDGRSLGPAEVELQGTAENVSMRFQGSSAMLEPFAINSVTIHFTTRRGLR